MSATAVHSPMGYDMSSSNYMTDARQALLNMRVKSLLGEMGSGIGGVSGATPGNFRKTMLEYTEDGGLQIQTAVKFVIWQVQTQADFILGAHGLMPLRRVDSIEFNEERLMASRNFFERIPQGGMGPNITVSKFNHKQSISRRGLAFICDSILVRTATGDLEMAVYLQAMSQALIDTLEVLAIELLLLCPAQTRNITMHMDPSPNKPNSHTKGFMAANAQNIAEFAASTYDIKPRAFIDSAKQHIALRGYGSAPVIAVMAKGADAHWYRDSNYYVSQGGSEAERLRNGPDGMHGFKSHVGVSFYYTRTYPKNIDPMKGISTGGEYVPMFSEHAGREKFTARSRSVKIYDQTADEFVEISLAKAIRNCGRWQSNNMRGRGQGARGGPTPLDEEAHVNAYSDTDNEWMNDPFMFNKGECIVKLGDMLRNEHVTPEFFEHMFMCYRVFTGKDYADAERTLTGALQSMIRGQGRLTDADVAAYSPSTFEDGQGGLTIYFWLSQVNVTMQNLERLASAFGMNLPFNFLLLRCRISHMTGALIVAPMGGIVGYSAVHMEDNRIIENGERKEFKMNSTLWCGPIAVAHDAVVVYRNFTFHEYLGGNDVSVVSRSEEEFDPADVRAPDRKSMRIYAVSLKDNVETVPQCLNIMGRMSDEWAVQFLGTSRVKKPDYGSAPYYRYRFNDDYTALERNDFDPFTPDVDSGSTGNSMVYRGAYYEWSELEGKFSTKYRNTGHLGPTYDGCGRVRSGFTPTHPRAEQI